MRGRTKKVLRIGIRGGAIYGLPLFAFDAETFIVEIDPFSSFLPALPALLDCPNGAGGVPLWSIFPLRKILSLLQAE